jgi:hypothetical protein
MSFKIKAAGSRRQAAVSCINSAAYRLPPTASKRNLPLKREVYVVTTMNKNSVFGGKDNYVD